MAWFTNFYRHGDCPNDPGVEWEDEWECACNDRCPACNAEIEPYKSEPHRGWALFDTPRGPEIQRDDWLEIYPDDYAAFAAARREAADGDMYAIQAIAELMDYYMHPELSKTDKRRVQ